MITISKPFAAGTVRLKAGETYTFATSIDCSGRHLVKDGAGARPIINYSGPMGSAALTVALGTMGSVSDIDFQLGKNNYAISSHGAFAGVNGDIRGGGAANITGADGDCVFTNWHLRTIFGKFGWYIGGVTVKNSPTEFKQRGSKSLTLNQCGADHGSLYESMIRIHNTERVVINGGTWNNSDGTKAALRAHDGGEVIINGGTFIRDVDFGPLGEQDGGINLPPGPERDFHNAQRLMHLYIKGATFNAQFIKINPGIVYGEVLESGFSASKGGALFATPFPYLDRPHSAVHFTDCPFQYKGTNNDPGRVFSDEDGARDLHASGPKATFNGKPYTH